MNTWSQVPFLRLLIPFVAGILTAVYSAQEFENLRFVIAGLFVLVMLFVFVKGIHGSYHYSWIFGIFASGLLFLLGFQITLLNTDKFHANHFSHFPGDVELYWVKTSGAPLEKENSCKIPVAVIAMKQNGHWFPVSGQAMCYFQKDSLSENIRYGDCLILKTKFTEIKPPQNPSEFNYKRFLFFHNIYHQAYILPSNWKPIGINEGNTIIRITLQVREYLLNIYKKNNIQGEEYAVGSALVLGYTDKLDQDLINAYAGSGALHVLSVSGLHVGIIYIIFNSLLFFLDKFKYGGILKMIFLLFILWFYAALTGLSPSVLRSVAMFSFVVVAKTWKHHTNIFNTLAVSCFALLLYNPYLVMDVGFQLSYLAVAGIVALQPWVYEKWQPKFWLTNQVWQITSVSIAAQLATFPLGLLYFHQFPNYFLLSNLIVIPLSTVILGYGLLLFFLGKISAIGIPCAKIFSALVWFLNESVRVVDRTPGALSQGIYTSISETGIIYALLFFLVLFIYKKHIRYLFAFLGAVIALLFIQTLEAHSVRKQKAIIVYNIPTISAYDFIHGKQTACIADSLLIRNTGSMYFHIRNNWWNRNVTNQEIHENENRGSFYNSCIAVKNNFIQFKNKRIAVVNSLSPVYSPLQTKLKVDLLILSKNLEVRIKDLKMQYDFKKLIIDSSNSEKRNKNWEAECLEMKLDFYSVPDSGAYIEEI